MQIQAFRRREPIQVALGGTAISFAVKQGGDVVADVDDQVAADRLLEISEAYRAYGGDAINENTDGDLVLEIDGETLDLGAMKTKDLRDLAESLGVTLPSERTPVAELRKTIVDAVAAESEEVGKGE